MGNLKMKISLNWREKMNNYKEILSKKESLNLPIENPNNISIFISYSTKDQEKTNPIVNNLQTIPGVDIFYADSSIVPGDLINQKIIRAIANSNIFIVFFSKNSMESAYVQQEIGAALATNKIPVPILLDGTKPVGMIANNVHYLDFSDENKKYLEYNRLHQFIVNAVQSKITERKNLFNALLLMGIGYLALKCENAGSYDEIC